MWFVKRYLVLRFPPLGCLQPPACSINIPTLSSTYPGIAHYRSFFNGQGSEKPALPSRIAKVEEDIKEKQRQYRLKNRETLREHHKRYRLNNAKVIKERLRRYYQAHKQHYKQYALLNKQHIKETQKSYTEKNKEALRLYRKNNREALREKWKLGYQKLYKDTMRTYQARNKEAIRKYVRVYYRKNRLTLLEKRREYCRMHREVVREKARLYYLQRREPRKQKEWTSPVRVRSFLEGASAQLSVRAPEDWYRISRIQLLQLGGGRLFSLFGNLGRALQYAYPEAEWDFSRFSFRGKKSTQRWLKVMLEEIFLENTLILEDFQHPQLFWDEDGKWKMELDIWVPEYKIGLEYQGEHHYHDLYFAYGPTGTLSLCSDRDQRKREACSQNGITLIAVPYWWDKKRESLTSTLFQACPDIFPKTSSLPIPALPPPTPSSPSKLKIKEHQISSFLMHGRVWNKEDPTGWFISEKLDGFRAFWDGTTLYSKNGNALPAPPEFTRLFPKDVCLDGELWTGYEDFTHLFSIMRQTTSKDQRTPQVAELWKNVKFCVFDAPKHPGSYYERHSFARDSVVGSPIHVIPLVQCKGLDHLQSLLQEISQKKGEGLMLYNPSSQYTSGRTSNLLKLKVSSEEDVRFIKANTHSYSFLCEQKNGVECVVKCSGWEYAFPPSPGTVLTVRHSGFFESSQKLKGAFMARIRTDLNWEDLKQTPQHLSTIDN